MGREGSAVRLVADCHHHRAGACTAHARPVIRIKCVDVGPVEHLAGSSVIPRIRECTRRYCTLFVYQISYIIRLTLCHPRAVAPG